MIRGGRHVGDRSLFPENSHEWEPEVILEAFILQHYSGQPPPPLLICEHPISASVVSLLESQADKAIRVVQPQHVEMQRWLEMSQKNATLALSQRRLLAQQQGLRLAALSEVSGIEPLQRLECFDISHTQGEATVASCVVYDQVPCSPANTGAIILKELSVGMTTRRCGRCYFAVMKKPWRAKLPHLILC